MGSQHSPGPWTVNGQSHLGWRIDSLGAERVGLDFIRNPVAIVPQLPDAELIARVPDLVDALEKIRDYAGSVPIPLSGRDEHGLGRIYVICTKALRIHAPEVSAPPILPPPCGPLEEGGRR